MTIPDVTAAVMRGFVRAMEDHETSAALTEMGDMATLLRLLSGESDEERAYQRIRKFALDSALKRRANTQDVSRKHFSDQERLLLNLHPEGRELLDQMADGKESAVSPGKALLHKIRKARSELGLD